jgi:hypothetical protein
MSHIIGPALLAAALSLPGALAAQQIGTVASSEPTLRGTPPGAGTRTLSIGTPLVQDETVQSSPSGRGQLLFADQTTLTMAPNTTIVLDRFVYDPSTGAGEIGLNLTQGALRFIGGTLSRGQDARITTPTASIGIRGSTAIVLVRGTETFAIFIAGQRLCIVTGGTRSCTSRQGGVLGPDGYLGRVNPDFLALVLELLDGNGPLGPGQGLVSGVVTPNPFERGPVSTIGEEFDPDLFDDAALFDFIFEVIGSNDGGEEVSDEFFEEGSDEFFQEGSGNDG